MYIVLAPKQICLGNSQSGFLRFQVAFVIEKLKTLLWEYKEIVYFFSGRRVGFGGQG